MLDYPIVMVKINGSQSAAVTGGQARKANYINFGINTVKNPAEAG
jgi:hypothetical protein